MPNREERGQVKGQGRYSLDYVRRVYGVPAKRGMRVVADGQPGVITSGDGAHIRIRLDGEKHSAPWHPTWRIDYGDGVDHGAAFDARIEDFNDWLNRRGRYAVSVPGTKETDQ